MMLPDNKVVTIPFWNKVVIEVVTWLTNNDRLDENDCPIPKPDNRDERYIVNTQPVHQHDRDFNPRAREEVNSLHIEKHHTAQNVVINAITIIDHVGMDASQFKVRW